MSMFLSETYPARFEAAAYGPHDGRHGVPGHIERLLRREELTCAGCGLRIDAGMGIAHRGASVYHSSCSVGARTYTRTAPARKAPKVIGTIGGCFVPLNVAHSIYDAKHRDNFMECVTFGAFRDAIADPSGVQLQFNHDDVAIPGRCLTIDESAGEARFAFDVYDTAHGRLALASVRDGSVAGLSGRWEAIDKQWGPGRPKIATLTRARLIEISLLTTSRPAYSYTWCRVLSI
jgi:HK97 family phage prohead protease